MDKELRSITDENSILITAEFLENGEILKVGERSIQRYEIELIVQNDITLGQLLEAIETGIRNKLLNAYQIDAEKVNIHMVYSNSRRPEEERPPESDWDGESAGDPARGGFLARFLERRLVKREAALEEAQSALLPAKPEPEKRAAEVLDDRTPEERDRDGYIICWSVFEECYHVYLERVRQTRKPTELERIKSLVERTPTICAGSIDYNRFGMDEEFSEADSYKISLKRVPDGGRTLKELGFITTTRLIFDPVNWLGSTALFDYDRIPKAFWGQTPLYNISDRPLKVLDDEPVHIIPPSDPPQKSSQNLLTTVLTPLLMSGSIIGARMLSGGSSASMGVMTACMGGATAATALINRAVRDYEHRRRTEEWRTHYQDYIRRLLQEIKNKQEEDIQRLHEIYPPAASDYGGDRDLVSKALSVNGDIFSRSQAHPDFLTVRIGVSAKGSQLVPSVFQIIGEEKETVFASIRYHNIKGIDGYPFGIDLRGGGNFADDGSPSGYLIDLPAQLAKEYAYLEQAPVLLPLRDLGALGIVFEGGGDFQPFLSNMLLDLCFYQSPDDLQCVMLCEESDDWLVRQEVVRRYKHLPHFRELLGDLSAFAFNKQDADLIFNKLLEILSERREHAGDGDRKYPHILVIVLEEYGLKRHPVSEYLPEFGEAEDKTGPGISFIFCKRYTEELPKYCGKVIRRTTDGWRGEGWFLLPHRRTVSRVGGTEYPADVSYSFAPDTFPPDREDPDGRAARELYHRAFKSLSALYYERIAQGAGVPIGVELFDIIGELKLEGQDALGKELHALILHAWGKDAKAGGGSGAVYGAQDVTRSLRVPIGKKQGGGRDGIVELDLHEKADGPHMLVAGTTGSGKTETILTYLIGLCALFTPEQVNLLLMDMKGAGFVQRIGENENRLPHVVGTVTDIADDESGSGTIYMLKRFLRSMNAEVKRRKVLLKKMGVDSVDKYTAARTDLQKHLETHPGLRREVLEKLPPLPHLFLVVDEFTELMRISADDSDTDFREAITSLARVGRSLGFHIILIAQNIEGAITPDIRVNSHAFLCLKVATREASKSMIGTDLAASPLMPGNGRAYLLVGTGSRFEYFQSGYSGADITRNLGAPVVITQAELSGKYSLFYDSESAQSGRDGDKTRQKTGITQLNLLVDEIRQCAGECGFVEPHCVLQQPLPAACFYEYDWDTGEDGRWRPLRSNEDGTAVEVRT